ncbi:MAG TPA: selenocysteine-specific translation elongation factor [Verrucomicrobiales bacterium]|nr:selenocysteine-specific translation elongation factor [Verrucomicrobiales bacterium]
MPSLAPRIIGTAGHIDHGKSTLVEALTGTNPDRLPEEIKRGLTIELGFAHLSLTDPLHPGNGWHAGLVDVPGHADYVRNMLAGLGHVDAALLVVAADDGWMPQTEEHFEILLHLHIDHGVVALTKSDLLADRGTAEENIRLKLAGTPWAEAPVVPVCALGGEGLDELRAALAEVLRAAPLPRDVRKPRLQVDRVFSPRGAGTVVTGTLSGGVLQTGEDIFVQPGGLSGRIRGLQNHGRALETAQPGMRTAARLASIEIAHDGAGEGAWRGHTVTTIPGGASGVLHAQFTRLDRRPDPPPLRHGCKVWLHHGTSSHEARVYLAGVRELLPGHSCIGELRTRAPVFAFTGDRFVLRDFSRRHTLAGGLVLETSARPRAWKQPRWLHCLEQWAAHPDNVSVRVAGLLERDGCFKKEGLLQLSRFTGAEIAAAVDALPDKVVCGDWIVSAPRWQAVLAAAEEIIRAHHRLHPSEPGQKLSDFRTALLPHLPDTALSEPLINALVTRGFVRGQGVIRAGDFHAEISPAQRASCDQLRAVLAADKYSPPNLSTFVQTAQDREALQILLNSREVTRLNEETVMLTDALLVLKQLIIAHLRRQGRETIAGLRDALGGTRRILVPVCELLDRERITRREGDWRSLISRNGA